MKRVCLAFSTGQASSIPASTRNLVASPIRSGLAIIAATFVLLHVTRHSADYDVTAEFDREDVLAKIDAAARAFALWDELRDALNTNAFLAALLLQARWSRAA